MKKEITCTVCPMGCAITVEGTETEVTSISGYTCKRGEDYGRGEFLHPVRILTSTVKVAGTNRLVPVRSDKPIPKELLMDCMEAIRKATVAAPVARYDVILSDVCGTGANIVATGELKN